MKTATKKLTALLLAFALTCTLALPAFAEPAGKNIDAAAYASKDAAENAWKEALGVGAPEGNFEITGTGGDSTGPWTVTILNPSITLPEQINIKSGEWIIQFDGTIQSDKARIFEINGDAKVTLKGGTIISNDDHSDGNTAAIKVGDGSTGTLTVESGTIQANNTAIYAAKNGTVNVNGGTVKSTGDNAVATNGSQDGGTITIKNATVEGGPASAGVYLPAGSATIDDGAKVSGGAGVVTRDGTLTVKEGSTITGNGDKINNVGAGEDEVDAAGIVIDSDYGNANVNIEGGSISGTKRALDITSDGSPVPNITGGNFKDLGASKDTFGDYLQTEPQYKAQIGDDHVAIGETAVKDMVKNAQSGQTVEVEKAPAGTNFEMSPGVTLDNGTGSDLKVNGQTATSGKFYIPLPKPAPTPAPSAPTDDGDEYITCEACGHHFWEPYLDGWRCTTCGHLRGTTGVPAAAAAAAPRSPQTGLWWLLG